MAEEDLIYGKNRHMFGGIEPSNMIEFSASINDSGKVEITANPPKDTVVNAQTVCSVAGAVIRRKYGNYPKDEFDGELIADIVEKTTFTDLTADALRTVYYSAFPYSIQGVYNRNPANRFALNEPAKLSVFSASSEYDSETDTAYVSLNVEFGDETTTGAVIRKSTTGFPIDENSGESVANVTQPGVTLDNNVETGVTYFYSAFPYNENGDYNRDTANRASTPPKKAKYCFGFDVANDISNPDTRVTYPSDVDNANFSPIILSSNIIDSSIDMGSWNFSAGEYFMPRPCVVDKNGSVLKYLNPNDYSMTIEGDLSNISVSTKTDEYVMLEWPLIYIARWTENNVYHFRISDKKLSDKYDCWCNYDINDDIVDHFYISAYICALANDVPICRSGITIGTNYTVKNIFNSINSELGEDWSTLTFAEASLLDDLMIMLTKSSLNSQYITSTETTTGLGNDKGLFAVGPKKVFGMENLAVNLSNNGETKGGSVISGFYGMFGGYYSTGGSGMRNYMSGFKYKITPGFHDGTTVKGFTYNPNISGYNNVNKRVNEYQYIGYFSELDGAKHPMNLNGATASTYECSEINVPGYAYNSSLTQYYAAVNIGGNNHGLHGFSALYEDASPTSSGDVCTAFRLSFRPKHE